MMELHFLNTLMLGKRTVRRQIHMATDVSFPKPVTVCVPGFDKIVHSQSRASKVLWIFAVCAFYGLCVYQLANRVKTYLEFPVTFHVKIVRNNSVEFPAISVCPQYDRVIPAVMYDRIKRNHEQVQLEDNFAIYNTSLDEMWKEFFIKEEHIQVDASCALPTDKKGISTFQIGLLTGCMEKIETTRTTLKTIFGTCVVMTPKGKFLYGGGRTYYQLYLMRWDLKIKKFMIHLQRSFSVHELSNNEFDVFTEFEVEVRFHIKKYNFLNTEENPCTKLERAVECRKNCIDNELLRVLECRLPFMENSSLPLCQTFGASYDAILQVEQIYTSDTECKCPRSCHETVLTFSSDLHKTNPNLEGYTAFTLIYPDNTVEVITENYAYPFSSLLSDIGGNLGFCVGICLFSFVEMLDHFAQRIVLWSHTLRKLPSKSHVTVCVINRRQKNVLGNSKVHHLCVNKNIAINR